MSETFWYFYFQFNDSIIISLYETNIDLRSDLYCGLVLIAWSLKVFCNTNERSFLVGINKTLHKITLTLILSKYNNERR